MRSLREKVQQMREGHDAQIHMVLDQFNALRQQVRTGKLHHLVPYAHVQCMLRHCAGGDDSSLWPIAGMGCWLQVADYHHRMEAAVRGDGEMQPAAAVKPMKVR